MPGYMPQQPFMNQGLQMPMQYYRNQGMERYDMPQQPFMNPGMQQPMPNDSVPQTLPPGYNPQQPGFSVQAPRTVYIDEGYGNGQQYPGVTRTPAYPSGLPGDSYNVQPRMGQFNNQQNKMQEQGDRDARRLGGMQDNWAFRNERNIAQGRPALSPLPPVRINR